MAHPHADKAKSGREVAKARYADGGGVDQEALNRAKEALRGNPGMATKGSWINRTGIWTPKTATDAQNMADSIRGQKEGD